MLGQTARQQEIGQGGKLHTFLTIREDEQGAEGDLQLSCSQGGRSKLQFEEENNKQHKVFGITSNFSSRKWLQLAIFAHHSNDNEGEFCQAVNSELLTPDMGTTGQKG